MFPGLRQFAEYLCSICTSRPAAELTMDKLRKFFAT
jgi:hypothetical protein